MRFNLNFYLQLTDLESALLNLPDPQMNTVQNVLDNYDEMVKKLFLLF